MTFDLGAIFDIVILGGAALSILLGAARGFVREMMTVAGFVAAAAAVIYLAPFFRGAVEAAFNPDLIAYLVFLGVVFFVVYVMVSLGVQLLFGGRGDYADGSLDRFGGALFGVARLAVLAGLATIYATAWLGEEGRPPPWLESARSYPFGKTMAETMITIAPADSHVAGLDFGDGS